MYRRGKRKLDASMAQFGINGVLIKPGVISVNDDIRAATV